MRLVRDAALQAARRPDLTLQAQGEHTVCDIRQAGTRQQQPQRRVAATTATQPNSSLLFNEQDWGLSETG